MFHGLDAVCIHVLGPFSLKTSGFGSGISFLTLTVSLIFSPSLLLLSGTLTVGHIGSYFVFIFLYPFLCLCFALL